MEPETENILKTMQNILIIYRDKFDELESKINMLENVINTLHQI